MITFQQLWDRQAAWSERTFGADRGPVGPLRHLLRELDEVARATSADAVLEWADVLILAIDAARRSGAFARSRLRVGGVEPSHSLRNQVVWCIAAAERGEHSAHLYETLVATVWQEAEVAFDELIAAAFVKTLINERRTWGAPDAEGVCEHVRGETYDTSWYQNPQPLTLPAESVAKMAQLIAEAEPPDQMPPREFSNQWGWVPKP